MAPNRCFKGTRNGTIELSTQLLFTLEEKRENIGKSSELNVGGLEGRPGACKSLPG